MPNNPNAAKNLRPFKKGQSGNPNGRPKGSKNLSTIIQEMLADEELADVLIAIKPRWWEVLPKRDPAHAMVAMMIAKACHGDISAASWIVRTGYGNKVALPEPDEREERPVYFIDLNPKEPKSTRQSKKLKSSSLLAKP